MPRLHERHKPNPTSNMYYVIIQQSHVRLCRCPPTNPTRAIARAEPTPTSTQPLGHIPAANTSPVVAAAAAVPHQPANPVRPQALALGLQPPVTPVPQLHAVPVLPHGPLTTATAGTSVGEGIPPPGPLIAARHRTCNISVANNNGVENLCTHSSTSMVHSLTRLALLALWPPQPVHA